MNSAYNNLIIKNQKLDILVLTALTEGGIFIKRRMKDMRELKTIQKREKLNRVYAADEKGVGGANHEYVVVCGGTPVEIAFQHGPRKDPDSVNGVLDTDLLEIVRDRLIGFQSGEFATRENAIALTHIEEALLWMNKRVEDRIERGVLGTNEK